MVPRQPETYPFNVTDALEILKAQKVDQGLIGGKWRIRKRSGGYFGLAMARI